MRLTKKLLEDGLIIRSDGKIREHSASSRIGEGEIFICFSEEGVKSELKNDGIKNAAIKRKKIITIKTAEQAVMESILAHFYFSSVQPKSSR